MSSPASQFYQYLFSKAEVGQVNHLYDANGNEIYAGIAASKTSNSTSGWLIWHGVYAQVTINQATVWQLTHESCLEGVIWTLATTYTYP